MKIFSKNNLQDASHLTENNKNKPLKIDVYKPFEQKEIDTRWIELKLAGNLTSRSYFASCIQAGKVYIHGGYNQEKGILQDFLEAKFYDLPSHWNQIKVRSQKHNTQPPPLRNHTLLTYSSNLILFGGQKNMLENNNKIYKFDLRSSQWQIVKTKFQNDNKLQISLDSHVAKIYNDSMFIFGGYESQKGEYSNELYEVGLKNINNNQVVVSLVRPTNNKRPIPRGNFGACIVDNELYIFGGTNSVDIFDDMWCFNFDTKEWNQIQRPEMTQGKQWPQKRKGHVMVSHTVSRTIFLFGGIREITKQQNDVMVFIVSKKKWIKIHKSTNQLYEPSPTIKKLEQTSPTIIDAKNRKNQKTQDSKQPFKLGLKSVTVYNTKTATESHQQKIQPKLQQNKSFKTEYGRFNSDKIIESPTKHQLSSLVHQRKMRQFENRKKRLLSQVSKISNEDFKKKRPQSPTSETLMYSLDSIGEQKKYPDNFHNDLPKVIFDEQKGALIGKKPCARDGHAGLQYDDSIIIIGGDRHMMSFNDVYFFKMDKAIESIHIYE